MIRQTLCALGVLVPSLVMAQVDTLWIVPGGVSLGGDTLAALRFCSTEEFQPSNETIHGDWTSTVFVNLDSAAHSLMIDVEDWGPVTVLAGDTVAVAPGELGEATHRVWSASQRGKTLGLATLWRSGYDDHVHFEWNLNEWDPAATWTAASGEIVSEDDPYVPRQFTINDRNYPNTLLDSSSYVQTSVGVPVYISIVNQGRMDQVLHFHGYHVKVLQSSAHENRVGWTKDTVPVKQGECVVVELNPNQPGEYPVHAHNLVAVTNAGFYPGGMITYLNVAP